MRSLRLSLLCSCIAAWTSVLGSAADDDAPPDPAKAEVPLAAKAGWRGTLLLDNDVGVWTVGGVQAFPRFGCPEVFGLDDKGRCTILVSYSGKWTPFPTVQDGEWLGALQQVDLDSHVDGPEMYTGGKKGNLFQIVPHHEGDFDTRVVARFPGEEIHTMVAGDLDPAHPGHELLAFSRLGLVWDIVPPATPGGAYRTPVIAELEGRVRQALLLPARAGEAPWIAATGRHGKVQLLRRTASGLESRTLIEEPMGFGRLAIRPGATPEKVVLYVARDDGVVLRLEGKPGGDGWRREVIYAGPQGLRGIAAGRFDADPATETVAVFGYSKKVQLLSRPAGGAWTAETIFEEIDKGHWLAAIEIDGRNGTDELIGSGYGTRVFSLARPPGYGLTDVPIDPDEGAESAFDGSRPLRVAVDAADLSPEQIDPLRYRGGFVPKSLVYEGLVRRDEEGRIVPALASAWRFEDEGRTLVLTLREGATFHDGSPVDAAAVRDHFERWLRLPEHAWLRSSAHVVAVRATSPRELRIETDRPTAVLPDLVAINPCAVRAPGSVDRQGTFVAPLGSGPYVFEGSGPGGRTVRYRRAAHDGASVGLGDRIELIGFDDTPGAVFEALVNGELDLAVDGWDAAVPRERLAELTSERSFTVTRGAGSSVVYLSFRFDAGPTADVDVRRRVVASVDREALVRAAEGGLAAPCSTWAAPTVAIWPRSSGATPPRRTGRDESLVLLISAEPRERRIAAELVRQMKGTGLTVAVEVASGDELEERLARGSYDLRIERTWGVPYDPYISLTNRFLLPERVGTAAADRSRGADPAISALVDLATRTPDPNDHPALYARIQARIDDAASIVPLYVPDRVAVARRGVIGLTLDHDLYHLDLTRVGTPR